MVRQGSWRGAARSRRESQGQASQQTHEAGGGGASADVVRSLYLGLLEREPSAAEVDLWVRALANGMPMSDIVREFAWSTERTQLVERRGGPLPPPMPDGPPLTILDIGAQILEGEDDPFRPLIAEGGCRVIGVEPLEETHEARLRHDPGWEMLPHFAGDGSRRTFFETESGSTSSLYEPNHDGIRDFTGLAEICTVASVREVDTVRLDDVVHEPVHLLKLDVQGGELDVLRGAEGLLAGTLVVHAEVEFFPIYRDQPLFDAVFGFLTDHGFELFDLPRRFRYSYQPQIDRLERLLWGDAVFIPDRDRIDELGLEDTRRLARIMHDAYGATGFTRWLLDRFDSRSTGSRDY